MFQRRIRYREGETYIRFAHDPLERKGVLLRELGYWTYLASWHGAPEWKAAELRRIADQLDKLSEDERLRYHRSGT